ncbi:MAG: cold shock domain-containing protein [Pirellulaceae bacterium]|nr:cold shock domain-containing protein [Pirellulaceae bacterium]
MSQGVIKKLVFDKGFGFIARDGGKDLFFHHSVVEEVQFDDLREGQTVEFVEGQGPKGPAAESVRVA